MIYLYKSIPTDLRFIDDAECEFNQNTYDLVLSDSKLRDLVEKVEEAKFIGQDILRSKFNTVSSLSDISTGCKVLLNIITQQDAVHPITECGHNIFKFLQEVNTGRLYTHYIPCKLEDLTFIGVDNGEQTDAMNKEQAEEWLKR